MIKKYFNGKAIYNPSGKAEEYSYWACNFYTGCSNNCSYCYCKKSVMSSVWSIQPKLKSCFRDEDHALELFEKELKQNLPELRKHGLFFSFTTDPLIEDTWEMTYKAVSICMQYEVPVKILTKYTKYIRKFLTPQWNDYRDKIIFGFTLTGHDELEENASRNLDRIKTMKILHERGYKTFASIEPIVDIKSSMTMIAEANTHCDLLKVGLMSGKKYKQGELRTMIAGVIRRCELDGNKVYFKDSLLKQAGIDRESLPANCVKRDYNLFR